MNRQRFQSIELLRIVLMFLIVVEHILGHGCDILNFIIGRVSTIDNLSWWECASYAPCVMAVDCFILISGYFGIRVTPQKILHLEIQAISTSLILLLIAFILGTVSVDLIIKSCMPVMSNYWWFLSTYILLCVMSPMINSIIEKMSISALTMLLAILFLFNCIGGLIWGTVNTSNGYSIVNFIYIYILGRYIKFNIDNRGHIALYTFCWVTISCILAVLLYIGQDLGPRYNIRLLAYNNPLVIAAAFTFFMSFKSLTLSMNFRPISKLTLGIYLFHDNCIIRPMIENYITFERPLYIICIITLIFVTAMALEWLRQMVIDNSKTEYWIENKIKKMILFKRL